MSMNMSDFMAKHGITDADLDRMAKPYEEGSFELEPDGEVFAGSPCSSPGKSWAASARTTSTPSEESGKTSDTAQAGCGAV